MAVSVAIPATHTALKVTGPGTVAVSKAIPLPVLEPSDVLVQVACISVNHVDGKSAELSPAYGATIGTDFSGVVIALGAGVADDKFRAENNMQPLAVGDRVLGGIFGNNKLRQDNGAFAEYVAVPARLVWHIPGGMDFATASTLPAAIATVGLSLFRYMELPMPSSTGANNTAPFVLVYGGGTATGAMAIQILRLAGFTPITTCSDSSAPLATHLGAAATFDYKSPTCGTEIREHTGNSLTLALDCITDMSSMAICYEALGSAGGRYVALDAFPLRGHTRRSVVPDWVCAYTQFGNPVDWAAPYNLDSRPEDRACAEAWYVIAQRLLDEGRIEAHPKEERSGGLAAVGEGMDDVRKGKVKRKKLVYPIALEMCV
jgi:aspyridone synthetase trans-acting enoyl reductase